MYRGGYDGFCQLKWECDGDVVTMVREDPLEQLGLVEWEGVHQVKNVERGASQAEEAFLKVAYRLEDVKIHKLFG